MRKLGETRTETVELGGGGVVTVRALDWRTARRIYRDARDQETGEVDHVAACEAIMRAGIVGVEGVEMTFPDDVGALIDDLSPGEANAIEAAALRDYRAAEGALGNSSAASGA